MALVIGLVGEKGGGTGTFATTLADIAKDEKIVAVRFSDLLRETLDLWHIAPTRANLQKMAVVMDDGFGAGTLSNAIYERVAQLKADIVIIDGVRWETDVALIRRFPKNLLVYITASARVRYDRTIARGEKSGESTTSFDQFMREEQATNELLIPKFGAAADHIIKNEGTIAEYKKAVTVCYTDHIAPHFSE
ncbi:hypothetical protein HY413_00440 [Candidatus Kaiserbacteria bacterium]|nr:hypothetical protein [Candidatus Kaiserbacteria bacterium]